MRKKGWVWSMLFASLMNIQALTFTSSEFSPYSQIDQVKIELESIVQLLQSISPNLSNHDQIDLIRLQFDSLEFNKSCQDSYFSLEDQDGSVSVSQGRFS